jgi:hypothetical protein
MAKINHVKDFFLNYNPEVPQARFKAAGLEAALVEKASNSAIDL